jgi:hypothetical protein
LTQRVPRDRGEESVGGLLGIGDKKVVVDIAELDVTPAGQIVMASASGEQLKTMPASDQEGYGTGLSAWVAGVDSALIPALVGLVALTVYALIRKRRAAAERAEWR